MSNETAYKIFQLNEWELLKVQGHFKGSPVDVQDGYIHLSSEDQVQGTLDKHYTNGTDVVIAQLDLKRVKEDIRFEVSRGGAKFPHLYADLPLTAIVKFAMFKPNAAGRYIFESNALKSETSS